MWEVEWVDLTMDEPEVIISIVDEEELESLEYGEAVGVIHINKYTELN